ncbi:hypothetical protein E2C01_083659 [Portunus trituberculatus]|uniref:Uncharacterized protein n=1 Tax=Portunus trituberculatus TaxID=210409 RepID=A0A5B7IVR1_PORTR|nr:hypothetical protein [Portunus trituberculatus]
MPNLITPSKRNEQSQRFNTGSSHSPGFNGGRAERASPFVCLALWRGRACGGVRRISVAFPPSCQAVTEIRAGGGSVQPRDCPPRHDLRVSLGRRHLGLGLLEVGVG